jgi:hypothetical protein
MVLGWTPRSNVKIVESSEEDGRLNPEHEVMAFDEEYLTWIME